MMQVEEEIGYEDYYLGAKSMSPKDGTSVNLRISEEGQGTIIDTEY